MPIFNFSVSNRWEFNSRAKVSSFIGLTDKIKENRNLSHINMILNNKFISRYFETKIIKIQLQLFQWRGELEYWDCCQWLQNISIGVKTRIFNRHQQNLIFRDTLMVNHPSSAVNSGISAQAHLSADTNGSSLNAMLTLYMTTLPSSLEGLELNCTVCICLYYFKEKMSLTQEKHKE